MTQARIHLVLLVVWAVLVIPTVVFWRESVVWIALMSIYAIIASHWACWEAAKAKQAVDGSSSEADATHDGRRPRLEWEIDE